MQANGVQLFSAPIAGAITPPNEVISLCPARGLLQGWAMVTKSRNHHGARAFLGSAQHGAKHGIGRFHAIGPAARRIIALPWPMRGDTDHIPKARQGRGRKINRKPFRKGRIGNQTAHAVCLPTSGRRHKTPKAQRGQHLVARVKRRTDGMQTKGLIPVPPQRPKQRMSQVAVNADKGD